MKKLAVVMLLMLGAFASVWAQDDDAWNYIATYVRYGKGQNVAKSNKDNVQWGEWKSCSMSVKITLDPNSLVVSDGDKTVHSIAFSVLDIKTDSNPANVLMGGFDVCYMDLAGIDWYLYKGQSHYLYLFYDGGAAIEYMLTRK